MSRKFRTVQRLRPNRPPAWFLVFGASMIVVGVAGAGTAGWVMGHFLGKFW